MVTDGLIEELAGELHPKIVVSVLVRHGERILLIQRASHKSFGDLWELPGGKLESHEGFIETALREVAEETGLVLAEESLAFVASMPILRDSEISHTQIILSGDVAAGQEAVVILEPDHQDHVRLESHAHTVDFHASSPHGINPNILPLLVSDIVWSTQ